MPRFDTEYWPGLAAGALAHADAIGIEDTAGNYTATNVEAALAELPSQYASGVRPESYGAVGDGVTDDATAIQAAITAADGKRPVVFASASGYYCGSTLDASTDFTTLVGLEYQRGVGNTTGPRLKFPSGVGTGITLGTNARITNLMIYGGGDGIGVSSADGSPQFTNVGLYSWATGAECADVYYSRLVDVEFNACTTGLRLDTAYNFNLFGPTFRACPTAIQLDTGAAQSLNIFGGSIEGYGAAGGIDIEAAAAASHINLYGTYFETTTDNAVGIQASALSAAGQINAQGCRVFLNYQAAWLQMGTSAGSVSARDNVFSCALVGTPTPIGLDVDGVTGTVTLDNNQAGGSGLLKGSITNRVPNAWESWTPVLTSGSGAITAYTVHRARYVVDENRGVMHGNFDITVTTKGTAAGLGILSLPTGTAPGLGNSHGAGTFYNSRTGATHFVLASDPDDLYLLTATGATPFIADGDRFRGSFTIELETLPT